MNTYIGIDPGKSGAIAWLFPDGRYEVRDMPETPYVLKSWLSEDDTPFVEIEAQQSMPKQGVSSTFSLGMAYGELVGLMVGMGIAFEVVRPQRWQKELGIPAGSDKAHHLLVAQRLYPDAVLCGPRGGKLDGRADALLIATFARRQATGGGK